MKEPVYLDYNATTPIDPAVRNAMMPYLEASFGNPSSSYALGMKSSIAIERARQQVANLLHCSPEEIIFTSGGTESNNLAIKGIALAQKEKGRHIITSSIEHPAVLSVCSYLETQGFDITYLPVDYTGMVHPEYVAREIREDTILISIMHANNEVGTLQPLEEISLLAKECGITFHTDASQSVGKIPTEVHQLGVDLLTLAGHKCYAPKGIGALYVKKGIHLEKLIHGAGQENGLRPGTENVSHIVGLGKACLLAQKELKNNNLHLFSLKKRLYDGLSSRLGGIMRLNGHPQKSLPNTLSIFFEKSKAHALVELLKEDVLLSVGSACHSHGGITSPVLQAIGIQTEMAENTVRISLGKYTTLEEIDYAIQKIVRAVKLNQQL